MHGKPPDSVAGQAYEEQNMAKRIFELAKELGVTSKIVLEKCRAEGIEVKNHMSTVKAGLAAAIIGWFSDQPKASQSLLEHPPQSVKQSDSVAGQNYEESENLVMSDIWTRPQGLGEPHGHAGLEIDFSDYNRQEEREIGMATRGAERYKKNLNTRLAKGQGDQTFVGSRFVQKIMEPLVKAVKELQKWVIEEKIVRSTNIDKWVPLLGIDATRMAYITIRCFFAHRHMTDAFDDGYNVPTPRPVRDLAMQVAKQIILERQSDAWAKAERDILEASGESVRKGLKRPLRDAAGEVEAWIQTQTKYTRKYPHHRIRVTKIREALDALANAQTTREGISKAAISAGAQLLQTLVSACPTYFEPLNSDFSYIYRNKRKKDKKKSAKKKGKAKRSGGLERHILLRPQAHRELAREHKRMADLHPLMMPMVCPPQDWRRDPKGRGYVGGYRHNKDIRLLTVRSFRAHTRDLKYPVGDETLRAVNSVQATAWQINPRVADTLHRVVKDKRYRKLLGLGPSERISQEKRLPYKEWESLSDEKKTELRRKERDIFKDNSHRQVTARLLAAIEDDRKQKAIWLPHFLDFRGRMYAYPQDLDPQASDPVRACLQFAKGKPLGSEDAENWLARQLPASYDNEIARAPLEEQLCWVKEHKDDIQKLANDPLKRIDFWKKAEDPWRFYAVCCEWDDMHHQGSKFMSHLPVSMDGRCNGLQHLAALAQDSGLGELVNLTPSPDGLPRDVYETVAEELRKLVQVDSKRNIAYASAWLGAKLITRKTVKRPVMTIPYGATTRAHCQQIFDDAEHNPLWGEAWYLSEELGKLANKNDSLAPATAVLKWLSKIAKDFAKEGKEMIWTNPAGMKVRLAYYKTKENRVRVNGFYHKTSIKLLSENKDEDKSKNKKKDKSKGLAVVDQGRGMTASLVHSFDAAHLAKTVNACAIEGIRSFAVIHDSYGTHACDAERMSRLLREQFVAMYSQPWLQQFAEQWRWEVPSGVEISDPPIRGDLDISRVIDSKYFFC